MRKKNSSKHTNTVNIRQFKGLLLDKGWTAEQFAEVAGCSDGHVSNVLAGNRRLTDEMAAKWAQALGCRVSDFTGSVQHAVSVGRGKAKVTVYPSPIEGPVSAVQGPVRMD